MSTDGYIWFHMGKIKILVTQIHILHHSMDSVFLLEVFQCLSVIQKWN
jgi:hypothetical protein